MVFRFPFVVFGDLQKPSSLAETDFVVNRLGRTAWHLRFVRKRLPHESKCSGNELHFCLQ